MSSFSLADLNLASVKPSEPLSVIALSLSKVVDVLPVSPVYAVPVAADIISSSTALPKAQAAASA